jgi:hypothetical protein
VMVHTQVGAVCSAAGKLWSRNFEGSGLDTRQKRGGAVRSLRANNSAMGKD